MNEILYKLCIVLVHLCFSIFFHSVQLLAPDIRHERNVLLQCVRYVVRNNFFGLESRPQNLEGIKDKPTPAILTGEQEGRQEKQSEEARELSRSASLVGGKTSSADAGDEEDLKISKAVVVDQNFKDQGFHSDQVSSEPSKNPVDSAARAEQFAGDLPQYAEESAAKHCQSLHSTSTDKIPCTSYIYDDEIWESPGAVM